MKSLRALAAVVGAVMICGGPAQAAPPAMEQSPGGGAALPAIAQVPRPDSPSMALAQRYLTMMHFQATLQKSLDQLVPMIVRLATRTNVTESQKAALTQSAEETMADFLPRFQERAAEVIATHYTTEELTALVAFYDTPIGHQIADKSLDLQQLMSGSFQSLQPQLVRAMLVRFCQKTTCPPELKAIIPNAS